MTVIDRELVPEARRMDHTAELFGPDFPMRLEPTVFAMAERLSADYRGGYWLFYALSNGGFYMAPDSQANFAVRCENGFEGQLSADALGITACLYAYSTLSFGGTKGFAEACAEHYHLLREYMLVCVRRSHLEDADGVVKDGVHQGNRWTPCLTPRRGADGMTRSSRNAC